MKKLHKLNKVYKAISEALGCVIQDDYSMHLKVNDKLIPIKVDDKQTYLPTNEALGVAGYDRAYFHPACESIASKETEMDKVLRKLISSSIFYNFRPVAGVLFKVASSKTSKTLSQKLLEELKPLRNVSDKVIAEVVDLFKRVSIEMEVESLDTRILSLVLKRGGKTENDEHIFYRCAPQFPFYRELKRLVNQNSRLADTPDEIIMFADSRYSYKAAVCATTIFELAIPSVKDPSRLESVSINQTAARMSAMLRTFALIADEINVIIGKFRKEFDKIGIYGIELDWVESLDELPDIASLVPSLEYNNYNTKSETNDDDLDDFNVGRLEDPFEVEAPQIKSQSSPSGKGVPKPQNGETYIGMKKHDNGVTEYRFRDGHDIRIVIVGEDGLTLSERYSTASRPSRGRRETGWDDEDDYKILPNGKRVPLFSRRRNRRDDYYDDRYDRRRDDYYDDRRRRDDYYDDRRRDDYYDDRGGRRETGWDTGGRREDSRGGTSYFDFPSNY